LRTAAVKRSFASTAVCFNCPLNTARIRDALRGREKSQTQRIRKTESQSK
jgi:hypothetical protein